MLRRQLQCIYQYQSVVQLHERHEEKSTSNEKKYSGVYLTLCDDVSPPAVDTKDVILITLTKAIGRAGDTRVYPSVDRPTLHKTRQSCSNVHKVIDLTLHVRFFTSWFVRSKLSMQIICWWYPVFIWTTFLVNRNISVLFVRGWTE